MLVYWELTRACELASRHCRAEAVPSCHPLELTTEEGYRLLDRLALPDRRPEVWLPCWSVGLRFRFKVKPCSDAASFVTGVATPVDAGYAA